MLQWDEGPPQIERDRSVGDLSRWFEVHRKSFSRVNGFSHLWPGSMHSGGDNGHTNYWRGAAYTPESPLQLYWNTSSLRHKPSAPHSVRFNSIDLESPRRFLGNRYCPLVMELMSIKKSWWWLIIQKIENDSMGTGAHRGVRFESSARKTQYCFAIRLSSIWLEKEGFKPTQTAKWVQIQISSWRSALQDNTDDPTSSSSAISEITFSLLFFYYYFSVCLVIRFVGMLNLI